MGTKKTPGSFDCYANALDDEPMFILLARDPLASAVVRTWAADYKARKEQANPDRMLTVEQYAKFKEAMDVATSMEKWLANYHNVQRVEKAKGRT